MMEWLKLKIVQTILSNSSYYNGNFDVELHRVFDTLFRLSQSNYKYKLTIGIRK